MTKMTILVDVSYGQNLTLCWIQTETDKIGRWNIDRKWEKPNHI